MLGPGLVGWGRAGERLWARACAVRRVSRRRPRAYNGRLVATNRLPAVALPSLATAPRRCPGSPAWPGPACPGVSWRVLASGGVAWRGVGGAERWCSEEERSTVLEHEHRPTYRSSSGAGEWQKLMRNNNWPRICVGYLNPRPRPPPSSARLIRLKRASQVRSS